MLSKFVITFLPRSKLLLISWLQSPSAVSLEPPRIKSVTVSIASPSIFHEVMGIDAMILVIECCFIALFLLSFISALLTMPKPLTVWIATNWKILKEMGILDHLTCFLRNLYAGQETTVRIEHETTD